MFKWLEELLEIKYRFAERKREVRVCESCEVLKQQLAIVNEQNKNLLDRVVNPTKVEEPKIDTENLKPINRNSIPWKTRQQMLEAEDRAQAQILKSAPKSDSDLAELEKELNIAEKEFNAVSERHA